MAAAAAFIELFMFADASFSISFHCPGLTVWAISACSLLLSPQASFGYGNGWSSRQAVAAAWNQPTGQS
jgi:hypothetical protein